MRYFALTIVLTVNVLLRLRHATLWTYVGYFDAIKFCNFQKRNSYERLLRRRRNLLRDQRQNYERKNATFWSRVENVKQYNTGAIVWNTTQIGTLTSADCVLIAGSHIDHLIFRNADCSEKHFVICEIRPVNIKINYSRHHPSARVMLFHVESTDFSTLPGVADKKMVCWPNHDTRAQLNSTVFCWKRIQLRLDWCFLFSNRGAVFPVLEAEVSPKANAASRCNCRQCKCTNALVVCDDCTAMMLHEHQRRRASVP